MVKSSTFLIVSTCKEDRYRDNLLAVLALPPGTHVQYRYSRDLVMSTDASDDFPGRGTLFPAAAKRGEAIRGAPVLLGYLADTEPVCVVPVRFGQIADYCWYGSHVVLQLTLREFAYAENLDAFTAALRASANLPETQGFNSEDIQLVHQIPSLDHVRRTTDKTEWEQIATQLSGKPEFTDILAYCLVAEIADEGGDWSFPWPMRATPGAPRILEPDEHGRYRMSPGRFHEVRVYHFTPPGSRAPQPSRRGDLLFETQDPLLDILSAASQPIDSPYDVKRFRFRTPLSHRTEYARITITQTLMSSPSAERRSRDDRKPDAADGRGDARPDAVDAEVKPQRRLSFDLNLVVRGAKLRVAFTGLLAGLLLSVPSIMAVQTAANLTQRDVSDIRLAAIAFVGMLAGMFAAFGLKKPL
ncbi:hypothetical protein [Longimicrobium sp.]|uniref:hypothetical protein n=1 Tax=Longimicrobium sp. TaxID=2029185 RepID=UPI003B3B3386